MSDRQNQNKDNQGWPISMLNGGAPWWARFILIVLMYIGLPTVMVGILLGMGIGWIPSPIIETHRIAQILNQHVIAMRAIEQRQTQLFALICRNTSYTQAQQTECARLVEDPLK